MNSFLSLDKLIQEQKSLTHEQKSLVCEHGVAIYIM